MAPGDSGASGRHSDYYDVLGVPHTASSDDITRAYRRLARQHHPDHNPAASATRFREITAAYDVIGDADRRRRYDADLRLGGVGRGTRIPVHNQGVPAPGPRPQRDGSGNRPVIRVPAELAGAGTIAVLDLTEDAPCARCEGSGLEQAPGPCSDCGGAGSTTRVTGQIPVRHVCAACGGRGRHPARRCVPCGATGVVPTTRPLKVRVPAGVSDGATLRIRRKAPGSSFEAVIQIV